MVQRALAAVILLTWFAAASVTEAAYVFVLTDVNDVPTSSFSIDGIGNSVDVRVYLQETDLDTGLSAFGLGSAFFDVTADTGIAAVQSDGDVDINAEFEALISMVTVQPGTNPNVDLLLSSLSGTTPSASTYLATLTFTSVAAGVSNVSVANTGPTLLNDDFLAPTAIFPSTANATITVTAAQAIPEPASAITFLGLLVTAGMGAGLRRWRRGVK